MDLAEKVALVTGGGGHLGSAVVRRLLTAGAHVVACEHRQEKLDALVAELPDDAAISAIACDVTDEDEVAAMIRRIRDEQGGLYALLNIVGGFAGGSNIAETDLETWHRMFRLNLTSMFLCCKHALPPMLEAGGGRIVSISSKAAEDLPAGRAAYAVAKAGVLNLTECLSKELAGTGVACAAVLPSIIDTPETRKARPKADPSRWVTPGSIANVLAWLISEEAGAVNGSVLRLYGELT
ncbi:MAG: SDR family oxidoreductase [candidate division WS1 bacterium]|jgi:NAD(P)-dependent dehydrogenase (short-subunit alcohol dehydrogenase family)|nr:SDR family oxidoreductase [candidate division WS1 bacterium]